MVKEDEMAVFQVVLHHGENQINVGDIGIHPTLDFKQFRNTLNKMIGVSYNNLTVYLVDDRSLDIQPERRRKVLITSKVNFSVIVREKNCYFLVVFKRSRRDRRRKPNNLPLSPVYSFHPPVYQPADMKSAQTPPRVICYQKNWFNERQIQTASYMNSMILNSSCVFYLPVNQNFPIITETYSVVESRASCKDCTEAERQGKKAPFHLCVYDDVIEGFFQSPAGPISRPR